MTYGQVDPLDQLWKDIEKRKSQNKFKYELTSAYDTKILNACGIDIFILKQEYVYESKNKRYVRGNDDYYGQKCGIGIRTKEGILTSKHLFEPWKSDSSSLPVKGFASVRTSLKYKSLKDTISTTQEEGKFSIDSGNNLIRYSIGQLEKKKCDIIQPDSTGVLMLFYLTHKADSINRRIFKYTPYWKDGVSTIDTLWLNKSLAGGVFINVDTTAGKSNFFMTGILSDDLKTGFKLYKLTENIPKNTSVKSDSNKTKKTDSKADKKSSKLKKDHLHNIPKKNVDENKRE